MLKFQQGISTVSRPKFNGQFKNFRSFLYIWDSKLHFHFINVRTFEVGSKVGTDNEAHHQRWLSGKGLVLESQGSRFESRRHEPLKEVTSSH